MAQEFRLPDIGEGLAEGEIVRWLVEVGDTVAVDQIIVEVETAKAVVELPSTFAGVVLRHGAAAGETLDVGEVLVVIGDTSEMDGGASALGGAPESAVSTPAGQSAPIVGTLSEDAEDLTVPSPAPNAGGGKVRALPLVRKLARDLGVDIEHVRGTGAEGRITREDVQAAAGGTDVSAESPDEGLWSPTSPAVSALKSDVEISSAGSHSVRDEVGATAETGSEHRRPMSRLRRTIAANMSRSWAEIPHVTTFDHVDAKRLLQARSALTERHGRPIPIDALIVKAIVPVLAEFPEFNASLDGDDLIIHPRADVGIAVDTPDGLLVGVISDAGNRDLLNLADEVVRLGEGAKTRSLTPSELTGQTFTISNIGAINGGLGTPIIPYGTTAILSAGRAVPTPVARDGEVHITPMMPLSLSYDHRVIDGGLGRRFMTRVLENLAEPALFLV